MNQYQSVNLQDLLGIIESMQINEERMQLLSERYPEIYTSLLICRGMKHELEQYMTRCKSFEDDYKVYSNYILGYWEPHLKMLHD